MIKRLNVSQARANFPDLFHTAVRSHQPVAVSRGNRRDEALVALSQEDFLKILRTFSFQVTTTYDADNQVWVADLGTTAGDGLGHLWATGETEQEAMTGLAQDLADYAKEYFDRAELFLNAPNRAHHAPWLLRILFCDTADDVVTLLEKAANA